MEDYEEKSNDFTNNNGSIINKEIEKETKMELTSKRRAYLRKKAHDLDALVRIGKEGVTDNLIQSILDAIESRELIKVKILQNCEEEKMEIMEQLSQCKEFEVVGIIGRTIILFKENKDKPVISLELKSI